MALVMYYFPHLVSVSFMRQQNTKVSLIIIFKYSKRVTLYNVGSVTNISLVKKETLWRCSSIFKSWGGEWQS